MVRPHHRSGARMSLAAVLLAVAMLLTGGRTRTTIGRRAVVALPAASVGDVDDPLAVASALDVFAACLSSGMAVAGAARATAPFAPQALADVLGRAADLLALGADADDGLGRPQTRRATHASTALCGSPVGRRRREPLWRRRCPNSPTSRGGTRRTRRGPPPSARRCSSPVRWASATCLRSSVSGSSRWWSVWPVTCCGRACGEPSRGSRRCREPWEDEWETEMIERQRLSTAAGAAGAAGGGRVRDVAPSSTPSAPSRRRRSGRSCTRWSPGDSIVSALTNIITRALNTNV